MPCPSVSTDHGWVAAEPVLPWMASLGWERLPLSKWGAHSLWGVGIGCLAHAVSDSLNLNSCST